ncbi:hypothetical protein E4U39_003291 [Claviceps sp. Clav50 group G5]|nr:hypothetical protein E4U39_003291 [Claviceps sp. Clav50 group G5]
MYAHAGFWTISAAPSAADASNSPTEYSPTVQQSYSPTVQQSNNSPTTVLQQSYNSPTTVLQQSYNSPTTVLQQSYSSTALQFYSPIVQ